MPFLVSIIYFLRYLIVSIFKIIAELENLYTTLSLISYRLQVINFQRAGNHARMHRHEITILRNLILVARFAS